ncbi:methyltransferase domain-containing protein [Emticicia sp. C21]|uniref:methyltransferase domain-containing protein n=1 Tax=Emticicia sp. C21 TaxID=2302915 RepID=UPI000E354B26|nr:methyltransferase domain-containing protein [Emticicia sp. C21]RFS15122.1 methyltransferase domain-containing protein [Emticicia sp. C21]
MNQHILSVVDSNTSLLQCPICNKDFEGHTTQLVCKNKHTFDVDRHNYINLFHKAVKSHYHKNLFQARSHLIENGFFQALESVIVRLLMEELERKTSLTILDVGCGDGALFTNILLSLRWDKRQVNSFGIDITKEGIHYASKQDSQTTWLVNDLTHLPFKDQSIDIILNTLSPANYHEFKRVLKPDGMIIKTIPNARYLEELGTLQNKQPYSDTKVINLFEEHMMLCKQMQVSDKKHLIDEERAEVLQMTPLAWGNQLTVENIRQMDNINIDLQILVGQPK